MSKRRDLRTRSNAYFNNTSLDDHKLRNSSFFGAETIKSKYIPAGKHHLSDVHVSQSEQKKDKLYNRYAYCDLETFLFSGNLLIKMIHRNCHSCPLFVGARSISLASTLFIT